MQSPHASRAVAAPLGDDPSRRLFLAAGSASAVFGALSAAAQECDSIFAAIERHKTAARAFEAACSLVDDVAAEEEGRKVTAEDEAAHVAARDADEAALFAMLSTVPTSRSGARAVIQYVASIDWHGEKLRALAASLAASPALADLTI